MSYLMLKHLHMTAALLLGLLFVIRGGLLMAGSRHVNVLPLRILPHVLALVVVVFGILLTKAMGGVPGWVWLKLGLLLAYMALSGIGFKRAGIDGKTSGVARGCLLAAALAYTAALIIAFHHGLPW